MDTKNITNQRIIPSFALINNKNLTEISLKFNIMTLDIDKE